MDHRPESALSSNEDGQAGQVCILDAGVSEMGFLSPTYNRLNQQSDMILQLADPLADPLAVAGSLNVYFWPLKWLSKELVVSCLCRPRSSLARSAQLRCRYCPGRTWRYHEHLSFLLRPLAFLLDVCTCCPHVTLQRSDR